MKPKVKRVGWRKISDEFWVLIQPLLPKFRKSPKGGRPRKDIRLVLNAILYVLRTGCQWKMLPKEFPSGSTCHRYFQLLVRTGFFDKVWVKMLKEYDRKKGIRWKWQSGDSHTVQAPVKGGRSVKIRQIGQKMAVKGMF